MDGAGVYAGASFERVLCGASLRVRSQAKQLNRTTLVALIAVASRINIDFVAEWVTCVERRDTS